MTKRLKERPLLIFRMITSAPSVVREKTIFHRHNETR